MNLRHLVLLAVLAGCNQPETLPPRTHVPSHVKIEHPTLITAANHFRSRSKDTLYVNGDDPWTGGLTVKSATTYKTDSTLGTATYNEDCDNSLPPSPLHLTICSISEYGVGYKPHTVKHSHP